MKTFRTKYIAIIILLCSSCANHAYRNISIETAHNPSQVLPNNIKSIAIVDRATNEDFQVYDKQKTQQYFFDKKFNTDAVILDSLASDTTLKVLGQLIYESGYFDVVIPSDRYYPHQNKYYELPNPFNWSEVEQICSDYNTDAVLAIERFYNKIFTSYSVHNDNYGTPYAVASINSKYDIVAKVYNNVTKEILEQITISDTIYWQKMGTSSKQIFIELPSIKECLIQTGIQAALDIDSKISPQWKKEKRIFFLLDKDEKNEYSKILDKASENDWDSLHNYWLKFENSSNKSAKSKAQFNIALSYEMLGDINKAIEWANYSIETKYMQQTKNYLNILNNRKKESNDK